MQLAGNGDGDSAKTVLLVSGVGQPRNQNHRVEDNSTEVRFGCRKGLRQRCGMHGNAVRECGFLCVYGAFLPQGVTRCDRRRDVCGMWIKRAIVRQFAFYADKSDHF